MEIIKKIYQSTNEKLVYRLLLLAFAALSAACSSSGSRSSNNLDGADDIGVIVDESSVPFLDHLAVMPQLTGVNSSYVLRINNPTNKVYSLRNIGFSNSDGSLDNSSSLRLSAKVGDSISPQSSLSLQIIPTANLSRDAILNIRLSADGGDEINISQLLRLSNHIVNDNGLYLANDISRIASIDGNYGIALPFVLAEDFSALNSEDGSIVCASSGFRRGNSCTLLVKGKSITDDYLAPVRINGVTTANLSRSWNNSVLVVKQSSSLQWSYAPEANQSNNYTAKLMVFNSGNLEASKISFVSNSQYLTITDNSCNGQLGLGSACELSVKAKNEFSGKDSLNVQYASGIDENISGVANIHFIKFNDESKPVIDPLPPPPIIELSPMLDVAIAGSLSNSILGNNYQTILVIHNSGDAPLSNLTYQLGIDTLGFTVEQASDNSCQLNDHSFKLNPDEKCLLKLNFSPKQLQANTALVQFKLDGEYLNSSGETKAYSKITPIPYSVILPSNLLEIELVDGKPAQMEIAAKTNQSASLHYRLTNTANNQTIKLSALPYFDKVIPDLTLDSGTCSQDTVLAAQASCELRVNFGPTADVMDTKVDLISEYIYMGNPLKNQTAFKLRAIDGGLLKITVIPTGKLPLTLSGSGSATDPYDFLALLSQQLVLDYTITNLGTQPITKFNIHNINHNVEILANSTCGYGITPINLASDGGSCHLYLATPKLDWYAGEANINMPFDDALISGHLELPLSYSYSDSTGLHQVINSSITQYINYTRKWGVITANPSIMHSKDGYDIGFEISVALGDKASGLVNYPLEITPTADYSLNNARITTCTLANPQQTTCQAMVHLSSDFYPDEFNLLMSLKVFGQGISPSDALYLGYYFALPEHNQLSEVINKF